MSVRAGNLVGGLFRGLLPGVLLLAPGCGNRERAERPVVPPSLREQVWSVAYDWFDPVRHWSVPVRLYYPERVPGPWPVIVVSHALGGTRNAYEYLGRHWAAHGYLSVHVQHAGSDADLLEKLGTDPATLARVAASPVNIQRRVLDVHFVLDRLAEMNRNPGPWQGRLAMERVGVAGHGHGAETALLLAGQGADLPRFARHGGPRDERVRAVLLLGAPVPRLGREDPETVYGGITVPGLHVTAAGDFSPADDTHPDERRLPFEFIQEADQYLIRFTVGDHLAFAGRRRKDRLYPGEVAIQQWVRECSAAFWDAYLRNDAGAREWLAEGTCAERLRGVAVFEAKAARAPPAAAPAH